MTETRCWGLVIPLVCLLVCCMYSLLYNTSLVVLSYPSLWFQYSWILKLGSFREEPHRFSYRGWLLGPTSTYMNTVTYMDESEAFGCVPCGLLFGPSTGINDQKSLYHCWVGLYFYSTLMDMDPTQNERRASISTRDPKCVQVLWAWVWVLCPQDKKIEREGT